MSARLLARAPIATAAVVAVLAASASAAAGASHVRYAQVGPVCPPPLPGAASCLALALRPVPADIAAAAGAQPYVAGAGAAEAGPAGGLTPGDLSSAYEYDPSAGGDGQTVAVVDAFDDPRIEEDLNAFDAHYGLSECTSANLCFKKVGETGSTTDLPPPDETGWSVEIALDVETVHAVCRRCKILLVEAESESFSDLAQGVNTAARLGATEISNSYGGPETEVAPADRSAYDHPGLVVTASAGDSGYYNWDWDREGGEAPPMPNAPASLPFVVAVGGTALKLKSTGVRESEKVWNDAGRPTARGSFPERKQYAATGGGCSTLFTAPAWQQGAPGWGSSGCREKRLDNDVAAVADPYTGFDIYDTYDCGEYCTEYELGDGWTTLGGTSLSSPLIASLYALAGGGEGLSDPALTLYGHLGRASALYDVSEGGDGFCDAEEKKKCGTPDTKYQLDVDCEGTTACDAASGFDGPSGVGAPEGLAAFQPLFPTALMTTPSAPRPGVAASFSGSGSSDPYPGGSISSYSWNWGDASPESSAAAPTHVFAAAGTYTVTLTVTDSYGLTSAPDRQSVTVAEQTAEEAEEEARRKREAEATARKREEEEAASARTHEQEAAQAASKRTAEEAAARAGAEAQAAAAKRREEEGTASRGLVQELSGSSLHSAGLAPDAQLASRSLLESARGTVTIKLTCRAAAGDCAGRISLRTLDAVSARVAGAGAKAVLTLAGAPFSLPGGSVRAVTLHLSAKARELLARARMLRARATILVRSATGAAKATQEVVTVRAPRRRRS